MATFYKTGGGRWRVQIRRQGLQTSKTFSHKTDAKRWARDTERKIERGESYSRSGPRDLKTFGHLIDLHIADMSEVGKPLRRSKGYTLNMLREKLGERAIMNLDRQALIDFGRTRVREGAGPPTVGMEISYIKTILTHAAAVHGVAISKEEVDLARIALKRLGIVGRAKERNRRPTEDEIIQILDYLDNWPRMIIPMGRIVRSAIATAMQRSEITNFTFKDVDARRRLVLLRNRKDPRKKDGNDQFVPLIDLSGYDAW